MEDFGVEKDAKFNHKFVELLCLASAQVRMSVCPHVRFI
jgi:hypothetical protein